MKGAVDPEYADWVEEVGGEGTVFTGVVPAVTLTLVPTIIAILDVFACATTFDGTDWFRVDKNGLCCKIISGRVAEGAVIEVSNIRL